jgi:penicillin-insensitive murein endopeptidase
MRWIRSPLALAAALVLATVSSWAAPPSRKNPAAKRNHGRMARLERGNSVGSPTEGHLLGGERLETRPYLRISPVRASGNVRWGIAELVQAIDRAARLVHEKHADAILAVGDLSKRGGGDIDMHHSHESGRDADLHFYMRNRSGRPLLSDNALPFRADGTTPQWPGAYFDDERNWELVKALLTDPHARVMRIFVSDPLRARLLDEARRTHAPAWLVARASQVLMQPTGALPHDNHFHLRIACPSGMRQCIDSPTLSPSHGHPKSHQHPVAAARAAGEGTVAHHSAEPDPGLAGPTAEAPREAAE